MNSEVAWVLVSLGTQVQPQIILDPDYVPDYLSVSYDYAVLAQIHIKFVFRNKLILWFMIKKHNNNAIFVGFSLICLESLGFFIKQLIKKSIKPVTKDLVKATYSQYISIITKENYD